MPHWLAVGAEHSEVSVDWYLRNGAASTLEELTGLELTGYLADLQGLGLAPNTVHGCFETRKAFANSTAREH